MTRRWKIVLWIIVAVVFLYVVADIIHSGECIPMEQGDCMSAP